MPDGWYALSGDSFVVFSVCCSNSLLLSIFHYWTLFFLLHLKYIFYSHKHLSSYRECGTAQTIYHKPWGSGKHRKQGRNRRRLCPDAYRCHILCALDHCFCDIVDMFRILGIMVSAQIADIFDILLFFAVDFTLHCFPYIALYIGRFCMEQIKDFPFVFFIQSPYLRSAPSVGVGNIKYMVYIGSAISRFYDCDPFTAPAYIPSFFSPPGISFYHCRIRSLGIEQAGILKSHLIMDG